MADDPVEEAREREAEEVERLHEAEEQAERTLEHAEKVQQDAQEQALPRVEPERAH